MTGVDWSYWANLDVVDYLDACILSLDLDPRDRRGNDLPTELEATLTRRATIAKSRLGGDLPTYSTDSNRWHVAEASGVHLAEFREWGEALPFPFTFPDAFPKVEIAKPTPASNASMAQDTPLRTRERNNLLRIIRALDAMNPKPLPQTGYAESLRATMDQLGLSSVSDDTIRKAIEDARALDS